MKYTKPQQSSANPSRPGPTDDDSDAARQRLQTSFGKAIELLEELGAFDDIAVMYQENPLSAELGFREDLFDMGRNMLGKAFEAFPDQGPTLEVEGEKYRQVAPSNGQAITVIARSLVFNRAQNSYRVTSCGFGFSVLFPFNFHRRTKVKAFNSTAQCRAAQVKEVISEPYLSRQWVSLKQHRDVLMDPPVGK